VVSGDPKRLHLKTFVMNSYVAINLIKNIGIFLILMITARNVTAINIIGGNLELWAASNTVVRYKIVLKVNYEGSGGIGATQTIRIFKSEDHSEVKSFVVSKTSIETTGYEKQSCIGKSGINISTAHYEAEIDMYPPQYANENGYYMAWETCCRSMAIINILDPGQTSTQFRTYFAPLMQSNYPFINSTPTINTPKVFFACKSEEMKFTISATDKEGDQLGYKLAKPFGYHSVTAAGLQWQNGYDLGNVIPGSPALQINSNTGEISVKPDQAGLFLFAISIDELRGGKVVGSAVFEYQLNVLECSQSTLPKPVILVDNKPVKDVSICKGKAVILSSKSEASWSYHWIRNGESIQDAQDPILEVRNSGTYQLVISSSQQCSSSSQSEVVQISLTETGQTARIDSIPPVCGVDQSPIKLTGYPLGGVFFGEGVVDDLFNPKVAGTGIHQIRYDFEDPAGCGSSTANQNVVVLDSPKIKLSEVLCVEKGIPLRIGVEELPDFVYEWSPTDGLDNAHISMPVLTTTSEVTYSLKVSDSLGCSSTTQITVKMCEKIPIPDAFTPNNDGINDIWELNGIDKFRESEITIYNRWGEVIFFSKGYVQPFNGTVNGEIQPAGMYPYKIKLKNSTYPILGSIMLIR
jgi:gliding motility-associated-like protein